MPLSPLHPLLGRAILFGCVALAACGNDSPGHDTRQPIAPCGPDCAGPDAGPAPSADPIDAAPPPPPARSDDGVQNGAETDVDCGGGTAPRCETGKKCKVDADCEVACNYEGRCIDTPSCKPHLGGDTCGFDEVGTLDAQHESCCRSLPVSGFIDPAHPNETVYLDKYEITAGRVRAFLETIAEQYGGVPNVRDWIAKHRPEAWDPDWDAFLPASRDGEPILVRRKLLGDPRGTWPGAPPVPPNDEMRNTGTDFQFNASSFVYIHGSNCSTHLPNAYGFPTFFYPAQVLAKMGPDFPPRADGTDLAGKPIAAKDHLDVKAMNCITNALLQAFCHWDGGQLATDAVLDFVTGSPRSLGNRPGCGTQIGTEKPPTTNAAMYGGRCADLTKINATYDAGNELPEPDHPRNAHKYFFPFFAEDVAYDKAWAVAAPGRGTIASKGESFDTVRLEEGDEPWMDLAGNLNEVVLATRDGEPTGRFGLKYRGLGYQSARSELNIDPDWDGEGIARIERPEAKAAFAGGRCMRFR